MDSSNPKKLPYETNHGVACNAVACDRCLMLSTLVKMLKQNFQDQVLFLNHIIQCWPNWMENDITHLALLLSV